MELDFIPAVETKLDFQGEVKLPGTKYDATTNTVGLMVRLRGAAARRACSDVDACTAPACGVQGPVDIKLHNIIATLTL